ncbi:hypothetical protein BDQ17DRAFT_1234242, partial [Cyathus striatus]
YDFLLTFDRERSLIWGSGWTFVKASYLLVRYCPFIESVVLLYHHFTPGLSREVCSATFKANGWLCFIGIATAEAIQTLRTWGVWKKDRRVGQVLATSFLAIVTPAGILCSKLLASLTCELHRYIYRSHTFKCYPVSPYSLALRIRAVF